VVTEADRSTIPLDLYRSEYRGPGAKNPATGRCIVDWRVFDVGRPLTLGKVHLPGFIFTDVAEKASAVDLIREALRVYVFAFGQGPMILAA